MTDANDRTEETAGEGIDPEEQPGTAAEEAGIVDQQAVALEDIKESGAAD